MPDAWHRCRTCHRLYEWQYSPYEYLAWGSEDASATYTRRDAQDVFRSLTTHRIADERFGRALAALNPGLAIDKRYIVESGKDFFPHHHVVRIKCHQRRLWVALSDDGEIIPCTVTELARIAATDPPPELGEPARAVEYADFVKRVTSENE